MEKLLIVIAFAVVSLTSARADDAACPSSGKFPRVGTYQVLRGDFHMHTVNSDGKLTTRERVEESHRMGYDVIAVTDHGKMRACRLAKALGEPLGLIVIRGIETGIAGPPPYSNEHINVIGVDGDYKPRNPGRWSEQPGGNTVFYQDELKTIAQHGGFVIYDHPHVGYREPVKWGVAQGLIQGIEVKNEVVRASWNTVEWNGIWCYPSAFDFGLEHNLTLFANTDAHAARLANPPVTLLFVTERSEKGVMDALHAGRTVAWFDGMLWGKPDMVSLLVEAMVPVTWSTNPDGTAQLTLTNRGPISLKAEAAAPNKTELQLPKGGLASLGCGKSLESVELRWTNVWVNTKETLVTRLVVPKVKGRQPIN